MLDRAGCADPLLARLPVGPGSLPAGLRDGHRPLTAEDLLESLIKAMHDNCGLVPRLPLLVLRGV